jgi:hypothetical protein
MGLRPLNLRNEEDKKMSERRRLLITILVLIGICTILWGLWHIYQERVDENQRKAFFSSPPPKGLPDLSHDAPPPPQP